MSSARSAAPVRVALAGAGYMALEHTRAFQDVPGATVEGVWSRTRASAQALARECNIPIVCDSIEELHGRTRADLVVIAVRELAAREVAAECFRHPWTCLLEKPAGYDLADAEAIAADARARGRRSYVALNRRHYSSTQAALGDLRNRDGPRLIHVQDQEDPATALAAGQPRSVVDNWMYANSIHLIDYFRVFGRGRVMSVEPTITWNAAEPRYAAARISFESGDFGLYEAVWNAPGPWSVAVTSLSRRWEMRPLERAAYQDLGQRKLEPVEPHEWDLRFKPGLRLQAQRAADAVRGLPAELPDLDDALASMRLVRDIYGLDGR